MKSNEFWGLYNYDNLWVVNKTQRACRKEAEEATCESWSKCKKYFQIVKVTINKLP